MIPVTECRTAEDVMRLHQQVRERLRRQYPAPKPVRVVVHRPVVVDDEPRSEPPVPVIADAPPMPPRAHPLVIGIEDAPPRSAAISVETPDIPVFAFIQRRVGRFYGITRDQILGQSRQSQIVQARHMAVYLSLRIKAASTTETSMAFGGRDHKTVIYADKTVRASIRSNPETAEAADYLEAAIRDEWAALVIRTGMAVSAANDGEAGE